MAALSVILPTHDPDPTRLARTLAGLKAQTLPVGQWELVIVDNAGSDAAALRSPDLRWQPRSRIVREPTLGLTPARLSGFAAAEGEILVLVDDDNVLAPEYLETVQSCFAADAGLGAIGGKCLPEFEAPPPAWVREFDGLLALRDPGEDAERHAWSDPANRSYPKCAPIGAGLALRRAGAAAYRTALANDARRRALDRQGRQLVSGGDNDLVMTVLEAGLDVAYIPRLRLTHLIPQRRCERRYLGALNRAISRSWIRVLAMHGIRPWRPVSRWTVPLRQLRAGMRTRAWRGPANWVRWQGACGHFEGLADLHRDDRRAR